MPDGKTIPKTLHFVWIGDETLRPDNCIATWRELNPDLEIKVWGNEERATGQWRTRHHMKAMERTGQIYGVVDLMRWEILYEHGGFALDCDSVCLQAVPDWLFDCTAFTCWENEIVSPGLIANGYFAASPGDRLLSYFLDSLLRRKDIATSRKWWRIKRKRSSAWKVTGPLAISNAYRDFAYGDLTILPSHFFIPRHPSGRVYRGHGPVICDQLFGSTKSSQISYKELCGLAPDELRSVVANRLDSLELAVKE